MQKCSEDAGAAAINLSASQSAAAMAEYRSVHNHTGVCPPLASPALGTLQQVSGDGLRVGSVFILHCPVRHQAMSGGQISCVWSQEDNSTHWSGGTPHCRPLPHIDDKGFRLALLLAFISCAIILLMSIIFITSCLRGCVKREERRRMERARKTELWQQLNIAEAEMQREMLHNQKNTNNNNHNNNNINNNHNCNNINNNNSRSDRAKQHTGVLSTPHTCVQLHPCQCSVILHPPSDCSLVCRPLLQDPIWNTQTTHTHTHTALRMSSTDADQHSSSNR
ncbi:LOW QUALITY PROTEIN: sushi domain-containing protein 3 [Danio aesculapii]|uniref:LOW QUALITY PROTEIN: sushi domain-containing protein 3 n=1 Tax=Danio aesculapii TaxID=1142201 RepID=UPI0024C07E6A|nr:LOW QUALITY PROTEIN: sushi domain-containing protein 3 [Danio aesculapii]